MKEDPVLQSMAEELRYLMDAEEYSPEWQVRVDKLRAEYSVARAQIMKELEESGVTERLDLGNLEQLVVIGIIGGNVGHKERAPTGEEVKQLAKLLPDIVAASKGNETIQKDGEGGEGEPE